MINTISINFRGGIIPAADLYNILVAVSTVKVRDVRFGLRQQLLIDLEHFNVEAVKEELDKLQVTYEVDSSKYPNVCSSYPAEDVFIRSSWLSEEIYKKIFSAIDTLPQLKINICDSNQSFSPILTGNINWVASPDEENYWYLIIRFPKTNVIFDWDMLCHTNEIASVTKHIERIILNHASEFIDTETANGYALFALLDTKAFNLKPAAKAVVLPQFNLPYYEGLNKYGDRYWLGIYRRDELFPVQFLKKLARLCMNTGSQICSTAWKSILIKGIEEKDKEQWNLLLEAFQINMRHAANELNFQIEDNCIEGLELKNYLVKHLSIDDTRTFGICIGVKTRKKSEVFSSILVRSRYMIDFLGIKLFKVYDLLCAKDFNPNERTGDVFSYGNPKAVLPEQLRRCILKYYQYRAAIVKGETPPPIKSGGH